MKVFITGGTGLLGRNLIRYLRDGHELAYGYFPEVTIEDSDIPHYLLDIRDARRAGEIIGSVRPDVVVHTASLGNVDYVEKNQDEGWAVNVRGTEHIAQATKRIGARLIFTSSNAVFDGDHAPYQEEDPPAPINFYGKTKAKGESIVRKMGPEHAIVRPILMYGWHHPQERKNPVTWLIDLLKEGKEVRLVDDIYSNPLLVDDCSLAILRVIEQKRGGIYHVAGAQRVNRYEMGVMTAEVFGLDPRLISPVKNSAFPAIAPRPIDTTYDTEKMTRELKIRPRSVREGLFFMRENRS